MSLTPVREGRPRVAVTGGTAGPGGHSLPAQTQKGTWQLLEHEAAFPWHWAGGEGVGWQRSPQLPPSAHQPRTRG